MTVAFVFVDEGFGEPITEKAVLLPHSFSLGWLIRRGLAMAQNREWHFETLGM